VTAPRTTRARLRASASVDVLVVGAGFAGAVFAERLASQAGLRVLVCDRREHAAGNAHDAPNADGVLCHSYGPHIFHTNATRVVEYLSQFTARRPYEHRVLASVAGRFLPVPINRDTLNALYGAGLESDADAAAFLAGLATPVANVRTSEDAVVSTVSRELYELFFRGYTRKQRGLDPSELDASVCARIPVRTSTDDRYFADSFQQMPAAGYTALFEALLDHPRIEVRLGTPAAALRERVPCRLFVWTGPLDEFFGHRFGQLPYRSLRFEHVTHAAVQTLQPVAQVNHPDERVPFTRVTEMRHLTGQQHDRTTLVYEYPTDEGEPYYPVPRPESRALAKRYQALAASVSGVVFAGRLARYQYLNMDQVVAQALATFDRLAADLRLAA
jgi:UDP-galactopyranose mutase